MVENLTTHIMRYMIPVEHYCIGRGLIGTSPNRICLPCHFTTYQVSTTTTTTYYLFSTIYNLLFTILTYLHTTHFQPITNPSPPLPHDHRISQKKLHHHALFAVRISYYVLRNAAQDNFLPPWMLATSVPHFILLSGSRLLHARRRLLPFVNHSSYRSLVYIFDFANWHPLCLLSRQGSPSLHGPPTACLF